MATAFLRCNYLRSKHPFALTRHFQRIRMTFYKRLDVQDVKISIVDKGALDCTLKARVEGALFRGAEQTENLPWGGAIR